MATYAFRFPQLVFDSYSREPARWREDGKLLNSDGVEVIATDMNGVPGPLRTGSTGVIEPFQADIEVGVAVFGENTPVLVFSDDWILMRDQIDSLVTLARQAADDANAALQKAAPITYVDRDPDGRLFVQSTPIEQGGGTPVWDGGRLAFVFPTYI